VRLAAVRVAFQVMSLCLSERHSRSTNTLSIQRPRPSIEIRTPQIFLTPRQRALVPRTGYGDGTGLLSANGEAGVE
jgi:hypothetical protein